MPIVKDVRIVKVPLAEGTKLPDYPKAFPPMSRLYLELLENKEKIKQDLIGKEYIPNTVEQDVNFEPRENIKENVRENIVKSAEKPKEKEREKEKDKERNKKKIDNDSISEKTPSVKTNSDSSSSIKLSKKLDSDSSSNSSPSSSSRSVIENKPKENISAASSNDLSARLKELLGDGSSTNSPISVKDKYSKAPKNDFEKNSERFTPYNKHKDVNPPTLAELEAKGQFQPHTELRNINHIPTTEYAEEDKKRELIFKFDILKKSYPNAAATIPDYTIHSDLRTMEKSYDETLRRLTIDSTVDNYKNYMIGGFMLVEFALGNFLGFDMQGFTQQQMISMSSYERLLIEIGEKSYVPSGSNWPVELRLIFLVIINAGVFIVGKMIMRKTGANILNMINGMSSSKSQQPSTAPKRRMRGPNINLDDIPDADNVVKTEQN